MGWTVNQSWAAAETYPNRPIQVVICFQPGDTDMNLRPLVEKMAEVLKQPMPFVYKPGGGGSIGTSYVKRSKPDGYTILGSPTGSLMLAPLTREGIDYTLEDFTPICRLATHPIGLSTKGDAPWKTIKDLVESAQKAPGKLSFAHTATLGSGHVPMEMFLKMAKIKMAAVPCAGSAPAVTALLGGHVDVASTALAPVTPHLNSGTLRLMALFSKERSNIFPNVPTFSEFGYPVVYPYWYGLFVPKDTPKEVVEKLYWAARKVTEEHKKFFEDQLQKLGSTFAFIGPEEFSKENIEYRIVLEEIVKDIKKGLQVQEKPKQ